MVQQTTRKAQTDQQRVDNKGQILLGSQVKKKKKKHTEKQI